MGREHPRKHPHRAAGIAGIERPGGRSQTPKASAFDANAQALRRATEFFDGDAKVSQALEGRAAIAAG